MRTDDLKRIILKMFQDKKFYGYEVHKQLVSNDIEIEISRLYRVLNEMLREGLLEGYWEKSRLGPRRRVYQIGEKGEQEFNKIFLDAINTVHRVYRKYLNDLPPRVNAFNNICGQLTDKLKEQGNIAYVVSKYSAMHKGLMQALHDKTPRGKLYFIKPDSVQVDLKLDNLVFLEGTYNHIPLKSNYLDRLVVIGFPHKRYMVAAIKEWHRLLKQNGSLKILIPTILLDGPKDPLTIGDFMEKHEHENIKKSEQINGEILHSQLKNFFNKVKEKQIIHMTIISVSDLRVLQHTRA